MKTFVHQALLLLLIVTLAITGHPKGLHSLNYKQTLLEWPGFLELQFIAVIYADDIQFLGLNSIWGSSRAENKVPWMDEDEPETSEKVTQSMLDEKDLLTKIMKKVLHIYNYSMTGYHTIQRRRGCYVVPGGHFSHGFVELTFNNHDYIMLNEDLETWSVVGKAAEMIRQDFEEENFAKYMREYLRGPCVEGILGLLQYGEKALLRAGTPKTHVTHKVTADGKITLRCWALNFYPAEITLIWQKDGSNKTQDVEVIETRPSGDGNFQKWAAVVVPSGEEQRFTCHVEHERLPKPITLRWESPQSINSTMAIAIAVVLGALLMGAVLTFFIWKRRTKGKEKQSLSSWLHGNIKPNL
ncbi:RT1 class I, M1, gene 5 precursor [Rattus norvegicus]|uniref:RT1 class I, M1, gene 5 n=3 Tax=Rattus norvegicus TaxID=10116 RepID=A0A8I6GE62_RAT|nr:RT1 class I, M1, gene 5 precursor [Rattus norvegicus]|eukprot:NP_001161804.1 RT1 class I, M1, gene 5 precursor [Rattus norvegicus]